MATRNMKAPAADPLLDDQPFEQSAWQLRLDLLRPKTRRDLAEHLDSAPGDNETTDFLRGYLLESPEYTTKRYLEEE